MTEASPVDTVASADVESIDEFPCPGKSLAGRQHAAYRSRGTAGGLIVMRKRCWQRASRIAKSGSMKADSPGSAFPPRELRRARSGLRIPEGIRRGEPQL